MASPGVPALAERDSTAGNASASASAALAASACAAPGAGSPVRERSRPASDAFRLVEAAPFPFHLPATCDKVALVMIDMQRDFVDPGGFGESLGNDVSPLQEIVPSCRRLLQACRRAGVRVVHTRECHREDLSDLFHSKATRGSPSIRIGMEGPMGRLLVCTSKGAEIVPDLAPLPTEVVIDKPGKGAFYATDLGSALDGVTHIIFGGVTTEVCVQTTMREANDRGFECLLVEDCTASYFPGAGCCFATGHTSELTWWCCVPPEFKAATLAMITAQGGIVGWTTPLDTILPHLVPPAAAAGALPPAPGPIVVPGLFRASNPPEFWDSPRFKWEDFRPGVRMATLYGVMGAPGSPSGCLLRYAPGATVSRHDHAAFEHILVLSGSQTQDDGSKATRYAAGSLVIQRPGSQHAIVSHEGCVVLALYQDAVSFDKYKGTAAAKPLGFV